MDNGKVLKIAGLVLTVLSAGISIAGSIVDDKKLDMKVADKVSEALKNQVEES